MHEQFIEKKFRDSTLLTIAQAVEIIDEYATQGFELTLRQLYYQFVARDLIPNNQRSYNRLGSIVNDARLAGLIDWSAIVDRTRNIEMLPRWNDPAHAVQAIHDQYHIDLWADQPERVEVWIEKEALVGVIEGVCDELDVPYFACRGYVSQSEQYAAGMRARRRNQQTVILHLGDHDPSGIDMTRDNDDRLAMFAGLSAPHVIRIALNMDQVNEYNPPPNFAKVTDSRFDQYQRDYGTESWELDALEPAVINNLIREHVAEHCDDDLMSDARLKEEHGRERIAAAIKMLADSDI